MCPKFNKLYANFLSIPLSKEFCIVYYSENEYTETHSNLLSYNTLQISKYEN